MNSTTHTDNAAPIFSIECQDIILREFIPSDLDAFHALTWQPEIHEFLPDWNAPREQREDWFFNYELPGNKQFFTAVADNESLDGLCLRLGIVLKETGELIGWCCSGIKDELPPPNREIVYAMSKDHRSKGYTSQAAQAMVKYLFERTNVTTLNAIALLRNIPSNRVIQKAGFHFHSVIEIENEQYNSYKLEKQDWAAA